MVSVLSSCSRTLSVLINSNFKNKRVTMLSSSHAKLFANCDLFISQIFLFTWSIPIQLQELLNWFSFFEKLCIVEFYAACRFNGQIKSRTELHHWNSLQRPENLFNQKNNKFGNKYSFYIHALVGSDVWESKLSLNQNLRLKENFNSLTDVPTARCTSNMPLSFWFKILLQQNAAETNLDWGRAEKSFD